VWLVLDGTLGQNSIQQANAFSSALGVTGLVVTKLDGTAKGGAVLAVTNGLSLPVRFIGIGEGERDLVPFDPVAFVGALFAF
jgi:fused signal recognition particle receptor